MPRRAITSRGYTVSRTLLWRGGGGQTVFRVEHVLVGVAQGVSVGHGRNLGRTTGADAGGEGLDKVFLALGGAAFGRCQRGRRRGVHEGRAPSTKTDF